MIADMPGGTAVLRSITGTGVLSPLGYRRRELFQALLQGERGLRPITLFDTRRLHLPCAGELNGDGPEQFLQGRSLRPLDRTGRLAAAAAELVLEDSGYRRYWVSEQGVDVEEDDLPAGLVLGTMFGSVRTISEFDRRALTAGPQYTKPFDFANSVINAAAGLQPQHDRLWAACDRIGLPRVIVLNQLDQRHANYQQLIDALERRLRTREVSIRLNTPARLDGSAPAVVCTSARDAATYAGRQPSSASGALAARPRRGAPPPPGRCRPSAAPSGR